MGTLLEIGLSNAAVASVLALLAAAGARLVRRPALAHALWLLVLLKLLTPPLVTIPIAWPAAPAEQSAEPAPAPPVEQVAVVFEREPPESAPADLGPLPPWPEPAPAPPAPVRAEPAAAPPSWQAIVLMLWLATSGLWLVWAALHVLRFRRVLRHAVAAPQEVQALAAALAARLGLKHHPAVWLVPGVISPMLWTMGRTPRLLFPAELLGRLEREQCEALLAHELAHWRRRDHWVRFVELAALVLYWWHPVVWWARRELHEAEEQCCDAWAVWALGGAGQAYALALLETVAFLSSARSPLPVTASGVGRVHHLRRRLTMIMRANTPRTLSRVGVAVVLGLGLLLPLLPAAAQHAASPQPPATPPTNARDQQIEALKEAIRVLEAQKDKEKRKAEQRKTVAEDLGALAAKEKHLKARAVIADLKSQYEAKRAECLDLEAKYRAAQVRMAELEGKLGLLQNYRRIGELQPWTHAQPGYRGVLLMEHPKDKSTIYSPRAPFFAPPGQKPANLEQKLDRLLKEVDELRREMRGQKPARTQQQSALPQLNGPVAVRPAAPEPVVPATTPVRIGNRAVPVAEPEVPAVPAPRAAPQPALRVR